MLTKQETTILRRSELTINAADRFGQVRAPLLDRVRLWSDEAAAEGLNKELVSAFPFNLPLLSRSRTIHYIQKSLTLLALLQGLSALRLPLPLVSIAPVISSLVVISEEISRQICLI